MARKIKQRVHKPKIKKIQRGKEFNLVPVGGYEQPIRLPNLDEVLSRVDRQFEAALQAKDLRPILTMIDDLDQGGRMFGLGLARTFWRLKQSWADLYQGEGEFDDEIYLQFGKDPLTVERYIGAWSVIEQVEERQRAELIQRPVQDLIAIWQNQNMHGEFNAAQLDELIEQPDTSSVRRTLNRLRGKEADGNSVNFVLKRDGTLEIWAGGNVSAVGFVRRDPIDMRDPLRARGVRMLVNRLRVRVDGSLPNPRQRKEKENGN